MTGRVPGQLGIYGFRNRKDTTYDGLSIAHSGSIKAPAVWDALGAQGKRSVLIGVPPSFPPPKEFPGWRVGCFLTPPSATSWAYPAGARGRDRGGARRQGPVHLRHPELPRGRLRHRARPGLQDDRAAFPGRPAADPEQAVGLLHAVRYRARPVAPRVLAVLRPAAPALRAREQVRAGVPGLLPVPRPAGRVAPRADPRGRRHDGDVRPRRPPDDGRPVLQRLADPGGVPHPERARERTDADQGREHRLEPHGGVGRRRLLRASVPEREGPRAAGDRRALAVRDRARTS